MTQNTYTSCSLYYIIYSTPRQLALLQYLTPEIHKRAYFLKSTLIPLHHPSFPLLPGINHFTMFKELLYL